MQEVSGEEFAHYVEKLIQARRTNLNIDVQREISPAVLSRVCQVIQWAPNHHRTWPWQVAICAGEARTGLGEVIAESLEKSGAELARVKKTKTKFMRAPNIVVVGNLPDDGAHTIGENRDAAAAGIQNMLLLATSLGLASFWSTCPPVARSAVSKYAGFPEGTHIAGLIYLGWPTRTLQAPERPALIPNSLT